MATTTTPTTTTTTPDEFLGDVLKSLVPTDKPPAKPTDLISAPANGAAPAATAPATPADAKAAYERERVQHFLELLGLLMCNLDYAKRDTGDGKSNGAASTDRQIYFVDKQTFGEMLARVNELIALQLNEVFHQEALRDLEGKWRSISDLVERTNFSANIWISLLDAAKDEIGEDMS